MRTVNGLSYVIATATAVIALSAGPLPAATWIVDPGGGGHATTVAGGLGLASYGDTVLVHPGTYFERLEMKNGVVLRSRDGAGGTILDGSSAGSILRCSGVDATSAIEGFTLTRAWADSIGGAIVCLAASSPRIAENIIRFNRSTWGAAIGCADHSSPLVVDNEILDNFAYQEGGGILALDHCDLVVQNNVFRDNVSWSRSGGAMWFSGESRVTVTGNVVVGNTCSFAGGGIWLGDTRGAVMTIERNLFVGNGCRLFGGAIYAGNANVAIRYNTLDYNTVEDQHGGGIWIDSGDYVVENNILAHCNAGALGIGAGYWGETAAGCNDLWDNPDGDYYGTTPSPGDLRLDPMHCDVISENYRLMDRSPCLDAPGCGLIGAYGVGCTSTAVTPSSWGSLKIRFR